MVSGIWYMVCGMRATAVTRPGFTAGDGAGACQYLLSLSRSLVDISVLDPQTTSSHCSLSLVTRSKTTGADCCDIFSYHREQGISRGLTSKKEEEPSSLSSMK